MKASSKKQPLHYTPKLKGKMERLINHLRRDIQKVTEPKAQALFETSAEVLTGLVKAFGDYEKRTELAWKAVSKPHGPKRKALHLSKR